MVFHICVCLIATALACPTLTEKKATLKTNQLEKKCTQNLQTAQTLYFKMLSDFGCFSVVEESQRQTPEKEPNLLMSLSPSPPKIRSLNDITNRTLGKMRSPEVIATLKILTSAFK